MRRMLIYFGFLLLISIASCKSNSKNSDEVKNEVGMKFDSYDKFISIEKSLEKSSRIKVLHLNFQDDKAVNQDSLFAAISRLKIHYLDLAIRSMRILPNFKNDSIKYLSILTDTILTPNLSGFNSLSKFDLSVFQKKFPQNLSFSQTLKKLTINGYFNKIPEFVFQQKGLEGLTLISGSLTSLSDKLSKMKNLHYLDIRYSEFGRRLRKKDKEALLSLTELDLKSCTIDSSVALPPR